MRGDFKLNSVWYKGKNLPVQSLANQMASKVGQGQSNYGDLTSWSAWIQDDWMEGAGKIKPHRRGGYLYGEADSRVPGQLILPPVLYQVDTRDLDGTPADCRYIPATVAGTVRVGSGGYQRVAMKFTTPASIPNALAHYYIYASIPYGTRVKFAVYTDSSGPNVLVGSAVDYDPPEETRGFYWHDNGANMAASGTLSTATSYWLVVYPDDSNEYFDIAYGTSGFNTVSKSYNGSVWANITSTYLMYTTAFHRLQVNDDGGGGGFFRFNGNLYCYSNNRIYKYDAANDEWDSVATVSYAITSAVPYIDKVYFGNAALFLSAYSYMTTAESIVSPGGDANIFAKWNGFLWRASAGGAQYTTDGTTWVDTGFYVSDEEYITGMAGLGEYMYVATTEALYFIPPGDLGGIPVERWGSVAEDNGASMIAYNNALYITVNGRVVRYTTDGSFQDVWLTRESDLITGRVGKVMHLEKMNNWLIAYVAGPSVGGGGKSTIWAFQGESWHPLVTIPKSPGDIFLFERNWSVFYDFETSSLLAITPNGLTFNFYVPDFTLNPYTDPAYVYAHSAWVEWDWFDGPVLEEIKDYDSVTIIGENISSTTPVNVYWKDDDSTTWESLGTATANITELRWETGDATRPQTKRFKLAISMHTTSSLETPRINAIRVKYHLMVRDWFRWQLAIDVSGRTGAMQRMTDGEPNTLTGEQIKDNLDALAKQPGPFIYQDVDTTQYEVKITDATFTYTKHEYNDATTTFWWEGVYAITLEQIVTGEYTP